MVYLIPAPGLLTALLLALIDIRSRRVPRLLVLFGLVLQTVTLLVFSLIKGRPTLLAQCLLLTLACAGLQLLLALIRPGALGLGDVTATGLVALSLSVLGWTTILVWWLMMGLLGLVSLALVWLARRRRSARTNNPLSLAYVPVILAAAAVALAIDAI
ncbi:prepilin peptidase [Bifidobacterium sp. B4081]|uniref:prepilin peptidase n=1 Tax=unclassified Bifidobacterium TaxID=2608897 RepID=UPI00226A4C15|nr:MULTISPECIES: prepilin peptidase [unclassified Bifidobacterium]MCX8643608.1 prepilin peptidase [Bifidobacterium sp. B4077]MCX8645790.1 prepilin peptidase [Bifidobacterium sp. B4081]MCX8647449.1 prepilin peptidase [Bifidobacterium sp. B4107]MCX8651629.1 prepilin peptidase [Bifidobacterium sp. B4111]MCX8658060.1 prepilin peptidase [Bifidobacterium sp. B4114]